MGDFNNDGKPDLVVVNGNDNTVSILLGNPDGVFAPKADYATGAPPSSVTAADFNGDGKLDLAVTNSSDNTVSILLGNGDGTFQNHVDYALGRSPMCITAGDFNRDGGLDLAVANRGVSVLLNLPVLALFPSQLNFGNQPVNTTSAPQTAALFNPGSTPLSITNVAASGDYKKTDTCGSPIVEGASCTI